MNPHLLSYVAVVAFLLVMVLALEGPWTQSGLPIVVWIYLMREAKIYYGVINEILLSVVVICLNEVKPLIILYMVDRLTDMLINMCVVVRRTTFRRQGDYQMGMALLLFVILLEKVLWLQIFVFRRTELENPSMLIMLLLYVVFGGNVLIRTFEWFN